MFQGPLLGDQKSLFNEDGELDVATPSWGYVDGEEKKAVLMGALDIP